MQYPNLRRDESVIVKLGPAGMVAAIIFFFIIAILGAAFTGPAPSLFPLTLRSSMLARSAFWTALAVMYVALAVVTYRGRRQVKKVEHPLPSGMEHVFIAGPVAKALTSILVVELVGFILAAAAALYEALT